MRTRCLATVLVLSITPAVAYSQPSASDSMPSAGSWGAEVFVGSGSGGASLLRFQSSRLALILGADVNVTTVDTEREDSEFSVTSSNLAARLGMRTYRGSSTKQLRPVVGFGVRAAYSKASELRSWSTGVYAELGAVYFLTPHLSLGGTGELQVNYGKREQPTIVGTLVEQTTTSFSGSLVRVMLAVYF